MLISKASRTFQPTRRRTEVAARRRPSLAPAAVAGGDQRMLSRKSYGPRTTPDHNYVAESPSASTPVETARASFRRCRQKRSTAGIQFPRTGKTGSSHFLAEMKQRNLTTPASTPTQTQKTDMEDRQTHLLNAEEKATVAKSTGAEGEHKSAE